MSDWFYAEGSQQRGPLPEDEIFQKIVRNELTSATLVWRIGMPEWTPLGKVGTLASKLPGGTPPQLTETPAPSSIFSTKVPGMSPVVEKPDLEIASLFSESTDCLKKNFFNILIAFVVYIILLFGISLICRMIPLIGVLLRPFGEGFLTLGLSRILLAAVDGKPAEVDLLFSHVDIWFAAGLATLAYNVTVVGFTLLLIIPGIIVSLLFGLWAYLVVDRKITPFEALHESYYLMKPHLLTWIFLGVISLFICLIGFICLIIGIIPAIMLVAVLFTVAYRRIVPRTT